MGRVLDLVRVSRNVGSDSSSAQVDDETRREVGFA